MKKQRGFTLAAAAIIGATTVLYVSVIVSQGDVQVARVGFVVLLLLTALASVIGTMTLGDPAARGAAGFAAAGLLLSMGYLALFSVGLLLLVAGILMVVWLVRTQDQRRGSGRLVPVVAVIVGAALPWTLILLPT